MSNINKDLTIFMVSYYADNSSIENIIRKINSKIKIIIVENSNVLRTKKYFEKIYKNVIVILSKINGGQTGGYNIGLKNITTKYGLYLDIDTDFDTSIIETFYKYANKIDDFIILAPEHNRSDYPKDFFHKFNKPNSSLKRMNIVHGHFLFFNMRSIYKVGLFVITRFINCQIFNIISSYWSVILMENPYHLMYGEFEHRAATLAIIASVFELGIVYNCGFTRFFYQPNC
jgi:GT2 family glycosyltransferase